ncbi:U3 small nucleolar RNA-interacting protein 2 [Condylostylus longicornis]|uniref:U3 small nucleolar RNA-interacting protein 2 n=1 Tax=Condylostylus longicornis TaxID=2530218 RepID=UPI00244DAE96|nr:U3 small nucleolar RNA-interacting protein 2 [Condylostylus longicornis]
MSSFFLKSEPKVKGRKRKNNTALKPKTKTKTKKEAEDEEIESDDAFGDEGEDDLDGNEEAIAETPQEKRLRLAKQYLEEIEKEERSRREDEDITDHVSRRLQDEYLDSIGRLRKKIADNYTGYNKDSIKILKHKRQKLPLTVVVSSNDNSIMFSGGKTSVVVKWDLTTFKALGTFDCQSVNEVDSSGKKRRPHIMAMAISTNMKFLAVAEGGNDIQIWCPNELKHLKTFKGHRDMVTCLVFKRDSHDLYSGSKDRCVKLWNLDEMVYVESLFGHQSSITGIDALSRDRAITSGGSDCTVRIWKITEESQLIYNGHIGGIESVKYINDENFFSCGTDGSLCLWSTMKKKPLHTSNLVHGTASNLEPNWISAISCVFNTDLLASGSCDGYIRVWKMDTSKKLVQLFEIPAPGFVNSLSFTNDGKYLIAALGQEHKLGRWWRDKSGRNEIRVIELEKINKIES